VDIVLDVLGLQPNAQGLKVFGYGLSGHDALSVEGLQCIGPGFRGAHGQHVAKGLNIRTYKIMQRKLHFFDLLESSSSRSTAIDIAVIQRELSIVGIVLASLDASGLVELELNDEGDQVPEGYYQNK